MQASSRDFRSALASTTCASSKSSVCPRRPQRRRLPRMKPLRVHLDRAALGMVRSWALRMSLWRTAPSRRRKTSTQRSAGRWIEVPQPALGGRRPADVLDTPDGRLETSSQVPRGRSKAAPTSETMAHRYRDAQYGAHDLSVTSAPPCTPDAGMPKEKRSSTARRPWPWRLRDRCPRRQCRPAHELLRPRDQCA